MPFNSAMLILKFAAIVGESDDIIIGDGNQIALHVFVTSLRRFLKQLARRVLRSLLIGGKSWAFSKLIASVSTRLGF